MDGICCVRAGKSMPPIQFVNLLRTFYPQFAQTTSRGGYMQQDAEEFYNIVTQSISQALAGVRGGGSGSSMKSFLTFDVEETISCKEEANEPVVLRSEQMNKLVCNIQGRQAGACVTC